MEFLNKIQTYIDGLDSQRFYQYSLILIGIITLTLGIIMIQYYRNVNKLKITIATINASREKVRTILDKVQHVKREQKAVDEMLKKEPDFKIVSYFEDVLNKLGLSNKKAKLEPALSSREGRYQESTLNARFVDMSMKEVAELLQELEKNKRVFPKELEITASRKTPNTIDVNLTIATLEPRLEGDMAE